MITITIEGIKGSGKTKIGRALFETFDNMKLRVKRREEITNAALDKFKDEIDVLIIEKQS